MTVIHVSLKEYILGEDIDIDKVWNRVDSKLGNKNNEGLDEHQDELAKFKPKDEKNILQFRTH